MFRFRCISKDNRINKPFWVLLMMAFTGWPLIVASGQASDQIGKQTVAVNSKRKAVHLYFSDRQMRHLAAENRDLICAVDDVSLGRCIVAALIQGPRKEMIKTLPQGTELKAFFVTDDGTAYVDFNKELSRNHPGGARSELFTIFSIVNTLTLNLSKVHRVQILIGGRQHETLAGHIDISDPFKANILLIR